MRHSINIFIGSVFGALPIELEKCLMKYGGGTTSYHKSFVWNEEQNGTIIIKAVQAEVKKCDNVFVSDFKDDYNAVLTDGDIIEPDGQSEYLKDYFTRLHSETLTAINSDFENDLLLNLYLPLYNGQSFSSVKKIVDIVKNLDQRFVVDIYGLTSDLAHLLTTCDKQDELRSQFTKLRKQTQETVKELVNYKNDNHILSHFIVLQNSNSDNRALNLDFEGITQVICQLIMLGIENYNDIFNTNLDINDKPVTAIGLSFVDFDKYYFVQYLLNRTYLYLMEREGVQQKTVDIQKVSYQQHKHIQNHLKVYSDFFNQEVKPLIESNKSQDEIAAIIVPKMVERFDAIEKDMKSYISDDSMSLPDKLGIMSMLVGEDNEMLSGELFSYEYDTLDDLAKDPANFFINENNKLITRIYDEETGKETTIPGPLNTPVDENSNVYLPIDELKSLKAKIRETTADIRKKEELLGQLEGCIKSSEEKEKRLTENGFIHKGQTYRLLQNDIEEIPLEKTYQPHSTTNRSIDLRPSFTPVKNQGQQGACSAFALVSIYEYILKKENKLEYDLSESFLYYNARNIDGKSSVQKDDGSSFYYCIKSLETLGICSESDCPYDDAVFDKKPSDTAYENAKNNMVAEAMNVDLSIDAIKSAVEDGFPVAVSFNLYDSFDPINGFVCRPSDQEIKEGTGDKKNHRHAMVICGYSDDERIFIVRNSWGKDFGTNGYCYIPYSYVGDVQLVNSACIISKLCKSEIKVVGCTNSTIVQFNQSDSAIESQIIQNLISEMKYDLSEYVNRYKAINSQCLKLIQNLGTSPKRTEILKRTSERLQQEIDDLDSKVNELRSSKAEKLEELKRQKRRPVKISILTVVGLVILLVVMLFIKHRMGEAQTNKTADEIIEIINGCITWILRIMYVAIPLSAAALAFFYNNYKTHIRNLEEELNGEIERIAHNRKQLIAELNLKAINSRIAGHFIDNFLKLRKTMLGVYNAFDGYWGNLRLWYDNEVNNVKSMHINSKIPFIPLLSLPELDEFFENNKANITRDLNLYNYFDNDTLDFSSKEKTEKAIVDWKYYMKNATKDWLFDYINDFSIISYWLKRKTYDYLCDTTSGQHKEIFGILENASRVFLQLNIACEPSSVLFVHWDNNQEKQSWLNDYKQYFSATMTPASVQYSCKDKMTMIQIVNVGLEDIKLMGVDK